MRYLTAVALTISVGIGQAWALFESNKQLAEQAKITMSEAITEAVKAVPGKAVEAQIGKEEGRTVYEVDIIDMNKKERTVYVDAETGKMLKIEK